jgi:hypothetical protein
MAGTAGFPTEHDRRERGYHRNKSSGRGERVITEEPPRTELTSGSQKYRW